jgi:hypothetical protein
MIKLCNRKNAVVAVSRSDSNSLKKRNRENQRPSFLVPLQPSWSSIRSEVPYLSSLSLSLSLILFLLVSDVFCCIEIWYSMYSPRYRSTVCFLNLYDLFAIFLCFIIMFTSIYAIRKYRSYIYIYITKWQTLVVILV